MTSKLHPPLVAAEGSSVSRELEMEEMIFAVVGGLVLFGLISALVKAPGRDLNAMFAQLRELKAKARLEIAAVADLPNAVSA